MITGALRGSAHPVGWSGRGAGHQFEEFRFHVDDQLIPANVTLITLDSTPPT
ncbi:hypothetical protein [Actinoplanes sp. NPDC026619]|uniref:hypothetical protein n=1 Tax=Actinoplanes sp. NPDC026619 TaxID=3155798 RepID=UPI0033E21B4D